MGCIGTMGSVVGMVLFAFLSFLAFRADIRRFVQFIAMTGLINIADFKATDVIGAPGTAITVTPMKTGIRAHIISFAKIF